MLEFKVVIATSCEKQKDRRKDREGRERRVMLVKSIFLKLFSGNLKQKFLQLLKVVAAR